MKIKEKVDQIERELKEKERIKTLLGKKEISERVNKKLNQELINQSTDSLFLDKRKKLDFFKINCPECNVVMIPIRKFKRMGYVCEQHSCKFWGIERTILL